jgi:plasmid stabilization system protein ParE
VNASYWPQFWKDVRQTVIRMQRHGYPQSARRWFDAVEFTVERILDNPGRGHPKPKLSPPGIRVLSVRDFHNFLIYYRALPDRVEFLRVAHGRQDAVALLAVGKQRR